MAKIPDSPGDRPEYDWKVENDGSLTITPTKIRKYFGAIWEKIRRSTCLSDTRIFMIAVSVLSNLLHHKSCNKHVIVLTHKQYVRFAELFHGEEIEVMDIRGEMTEKFVTEE